MSKAAPIDGRDAPNLRPRGGSEAPEVTMELVDQLLAILTGPNPEFASRQLRAAGYQEDETRGAWNYARAAGYTESTGLGMDRLTPVGRARAATVRAAE